MIRAAIVGIGTWGRNLVTSVQGKSDSIRFAAGATRTPAKAADFCREHGIRLAPDYEALLNDKTLDAVVLATPHSMHCAQIIAEAKRMLADGRLGKLLHREGNFCGPSAYRFAREHWRHDREEVPAGGMTGRGVHVVDAMLFLAGPIGSVYAQSERLVHDYGMDDTTSMLFRFRSGATGYLGTVIATAETWRLQVFGSKGWVEVGDVEHLHTWEMKTCFVSSQEAASGDADVPQDQHRARRARAFRAGRAGAAADRHPGRRRSAQCRRAGSHRALDARCGARAGRLMRLALLLAAIPDEADPREPRRRRRHRRHGVRREAAARRQHAALQRERAVRSGEGLHPRYARRAELRPGAPRPAGCAFHHGTATRRRGAAQPRKAELRLGRHRHGEPHPGGADEVHGRRRHRHGSVQGRGGSGHRRAGEPQGHVLRRHAARRAAREERQGARPRADRRQAVKGLPDVPTLQEAGSRDYNLINWFGLWLPAGAPPEIAQRIHAEVVKALADADVKQQFDQQGLEGVGMPPAQFAAFVSKESMFINELAKKMRR